LSNRLHLFRYSGKRTKNMEQQETIFKVEFKEPPQADSRQTDFYFHSLAAIYDRFTEAQIGCKVTHLYNYGIMLGRPYVNKRLSISREPIYRKKQNAGCLADERSEDDKSLEENN